MLFFTVLSVSVRLPALLMPAPFCCERHEGPALPDPPRVIVSESTVATAPAATVRTLVPPNWPSSVAADIAPCRVSPPENLAGIATAPVQVPLISSVSPLEAAAIASCSAVAGDATQFTGTCDNANTPAAPTALTITAAPSATSATTARPLRALRATPLLAAYNATVTSSVLPSTDPLRD